MTARLRAKIYLIALHNIMNFFPGYKDIKENKPFSLNKLNNDNNTVDYEGSYQESTFLNRLLSALLIGQGLGQLTNHEKPHND